jgi:NTE family protein
MKTDLLPILRSCEIFSSLDDIELKKLLKKFKTVRLQKSKILFHQGSFSSSLYLIITGKLLVFLKDENNIKKILNIVGAGETVGEVGALSNEPRTATVKALENAVLLKLSSHEFNELTHQYPVVMQKTLANLMKRSRSLIQLVSNSELIRKHVVIISANKKLSLERMSEKLLIMTQAMKDVVLISDFSSEIQTWDETQLKQYLAQHDEGNKIILYLLQSTKSLLARLASERGEVVYVVARGHSNAYIDSSIMKMLKSNKSYLETRIELILLYENEKHRPHDTAKWLDLTKFDLHHHLRINQDKDWDRVLRFMRGQAIGVVLGGGGLRCWAQLGAIRAIIKSGIPIDIIGGTSAGAIVAGHYALHETNKDSIRGLQELSEATRKAVRLNNLTWPAVSVFNSKDYTHKLYELFGGEHIEDLWITCFCVTTNLSNFSQMVYRRGRLWKTIRSSSSVPGIFPPVVIKGRLHTDGGILNNLPVDVMRKFIGSKGMVIAVELTHLNEDNTDYDFPPILTFWQTVLAKLHIRHRNYKFPHFVDTFLKSLLAGASAKQFENSLAADLLISPDLSKFGILNVKKEQEAALIKIGYDAASKTIRAWRRKT